MRNLHSPWVNEKHSSRYPRDGAVFEFFGNLLDCCAMATRSRILKTKLAFRGPIFSVRRDLVVEPNGVKATRDVVTHSGSVVVLPVFPDGRMLLVRQYRHSVGEYLWELVAGRIDRGERPLLAARRELMEETGYRARRLVRMFKAFPTPGFVQEFMIVYAATGLTLGAAQPDEDEAISSRAFTLRELEAMMRDGRLRDSKSIAGILFYSRFLSRRR